MLRFIVIFKVDKHIDIIKTDDIMLGEFESLALDDWRHIPLDEKIDAQAIWNGNSYKVHVLQVIPNEDDDCSHTINALRSAVDNKNFGVSQLQEYLQYRVRPKKRVPLRPTNTLATASESDSNASAILNRSSVDKEDLESLNLVNVASQNSRQAADFDNQAANLRGQNALDLSKNQGKAIKKRTVGEIPRVEFPPLPMVTSHHSTPERLQLSANPEKHQTQSIKTSHKKLQRLCIGADIDPDSNEGLMFTQALVLNKISSLSARITELEKAKSMPFPTQAESCHLPKTPLFASMEEICEDLDQTTRNWISCVGGYTPRNHIHRVLNGLLSHDLQTQINRTGGFGKMKFPENWEAILIDSCRSLFPQETIADVQKIIIRFFKNAPDRAGGRMRRMRRSNAVTPVDESFTSTSLRPTRKRKVCYMNHQSSDSDTHVHPNDIDSSASD